MKYMNYDTESVLRLLKWWFMPLHKLNSTCTDVGRMQYLTKPAHPVWVCAQSPKLVSGGTVTIMPNTLEVTYVKWISQHLDIQDMG